MMHEAELPLVAELRLVSVEQLSVLIHKSPASIRSDASRNPSSLPRICRLPGTKRLLWRAVDISTFFATAVELQNGFASSTTVSVSHEQKRRGRPRKVA